MTDTSATPGNAMTIYLKGIYTSVGDVEIRVHHPRQGSITYLGNVISISNDSPHIIAIKRLAITQDELDYVKDVAKALPRNETFEQYLSSQYAEMQTILTYMQVFDAIFNLDEELRMKAVYEWSQDRLNWSPVPDKNDYAWRGAGLHVTMPDNFMGHIERLASNGIPVFFAFKHLYKAYAETNPRFKWINGTIAAEHAFKEFLSLKDPRSESLMLNIPSPPIEKLYKNVLFAYTNQESSMYKQLQKGAARRNELIHRPSTPSPDLKETNVYLHQVEVAIFELYTFLYPHDSFFEYSLTRAKERLSHVEKGGTYYQ